MHGMNRSRLLVAVLAITGVALGCEQVRYSVIPSGTVASAPPKPTDCHMAFFRTKPDRPYEEMPVIQVTVGGRLSIPSPIRVQELLAAKACELGADAVLVTGDFGIVEGTSAKMTGVALKFRDSSPAKPQ